MMDGLLRYQQFCIYGVLFLSVWTALLYSPSSSHPIIQYAPLVLIAVLGVYALASITYGVVNLKDCPEAALEVEKDVKEAKAAMAKKGVI